MSDHPLLLYLEADDEVTNVVRRIRGAQGDRVVLVAPGRSRATSSIVALRLLARAGEESARSVAVVGDPLTRSLAAEAGLSTYATVADARQATPSSEPGTPALGASIHIVRGDALDETSAVPLAAADSGAETRAVPVVTASRPAASTSARRRVVPVAALAAVVVLLLVAGAAAGALLLPAATITISPAGQPFGPIDEELIIEEPERVSGDVEAPVEVTATGTYDEQEAATGAVLFLNWNTVAVEVGAGALVAAGDQAFETVEAVVVPQGGLTADGRIQAGEAGVGVRAAAIGPDGNVAAEAIDTVLSQGTAAALRGFPNNASRLVVNQEPTAGGADGSGIVFTQADVDAAAEAADRALAEAIAEAVGDSADVVVADASGATEPEPAIEGLADLVGVRDQPGAELTATLSYDRLWVAREEVDAAAEERLASGGLIPAGHVMLPDRTRIEIGEAVVEDGNLVVPVTLTGASVAEPNRDEVLARVRGRTADDARAALADLGTASVELWPGWVQTVPGIDGRIDVRIGSP